MKTIKKIKKVKGIIALCLMIGLAASLGGPAMVTADTYSTTTTVTQGGGTGDSTPIIKAKWETKGAVSFYTTGSVNPSYMNDTDRDDGLGIDYTQIAPSGTYHSYIPYTICAIVTDGVTNSSGNQDLDGVWANEVHYPETTGYHAHSTIADLINGGYDTGNTPQGEAASGYDWSDSGCGKDVYNNELELQQLTKADGIELFCGRRSDGSINPANIKDYDGGNLTYFYQDPSGTFYDYDEICGISGELDQEQAYVYCGTRNLYYEDPAGDYKIHVKAQNTNINKDEETNNMTYLELQSFDVDFKGIGINYGSVDNLNQWYGPHGDKDMSTTSAPTVRNLGNTRLYIGIEQSDMGFGQQSGGAYNVSFRGRIGHAEEDWYEYAPNVGTPAWMEDILDLSEDEKMDLQIKISQWPNGAGNGTMILTSQKAEFRHCK